jgi:hypothetical protein
VPSIKDWGVLGFKEKNDKKIIHKIHGITLIFMKKQKVGGKYELI